MRTWINFKDLRSKLDFEKVLKHYGVEVKRKGDQHHGFCPLPKHTAKKNSPSFSANLKRGIFQCFGCGAKGNVMDFAALMEKLDPEKGEDVRKVAVFLQEQFFKTPPTSIGEKAVPIKKVENRPEQDEMKSALPVVVNAPLDFELKGLDPKHPYLSERGFSLETIQHFGLGFCSKGMLAERIAIPLHNQGGELIGYAGRLVDDIVVSEENPKYRFPSQRERSGMIHEFHTSLFLYNGHRITGPLDDLIVVSGFPSIWWLWQIGFSNSVALMGWSLSEKQAETLISLVRASGRIWILSDGDDAGERFGNSVLAQISSHRFCRWVKLDSAKQPTDYSKEQLEKLVCLPVAVTTGPAKRSDRSLKERLMMKEILAPRAIVELINSFPSLRVLNLKAETWDATALDAGKHKISPSARSALQFAFSVWNPYQEWQIGAFDVVQAFDIWDQEHCQAFMAWANEPWFVK